MFKYRHFSQMYFMQYFKPLTHSGKSTHGNSLKVAQICGKNAVLATLHPKRAAGVRFDWSQPGQEQGEMTDKTMLEYLLLNRSWAHWQICARFTQCVCDREIESECEQQEHSFKRDLSTLHTEGSLLECLKEWTQKKAGAKHMLREQAPMVRNSAGAG